MFGMIHMAHCSQVDFPQLAQLSARPLSSVMLSVQRPIEIVLITILAIQAQTYKGTKEKESERER